MEVKRQEIQSLVQTLMRQESRGLRRLISHHGVMGEQLEKSRAHL